MNKLILILIPIILLAGCSKVVESTNQQRFNVIINSYSKSIKTAPNILSSDEITLEYKDSIEDFLWSNAPFINWEGILEEIDVKKEVLFGREATEVTCLIKTNIRSDIDVIFLLSFFKADIPTLFNNLQECSIGSKVYFGFIPWQIKDNEQLRKEIITLQFNLRGGLFYIGLTPQLYSINSQKIIAVYDSLRSMNPIEYIRIMDSIPSDFEKLSTDEQIFIKEFSSFRNLYDKDYPRKKAIN